MHEHRARIRRFLGHLRQLPGETWQDRWALFEGQVGHDALTWRLRIAGGSSKNTKNRNEVEGLNAAMGPLLALDVMRPSHRWLAGQRFAFWKALSRFRDPAHTAELENALVHAKAAMPKPLAGAWQGTPFAHSGVPRGLLHARLGRASTPRSFPCLNISYRKRGRMSLNVPVP